MARKTQQNSITSPELIAQVAPANVSLKKEFLGYLKSVGRAESTIYTYENDLDIFFVWNLKENKNTLFQKVTKRDLIRYQSWLINENGNSPSRVRRLRSTLSSLSNYIENIIADEDEDFAGFRSIIRKIEAPAMGSTREKTVWTEEEIKGLLDALLADNQYEKACYLALAVYSGRRKSELFRYKVVCFEKSNLIADGKLYFTPKIRTKGRGKDGKQLNTYVIAEPFQPYFDAWMAYRKKYSIESEWLFPCPADMSRHRFCSTANSWANTFSQIAGRPAYIHSFRHFSCTQLLRAGLPDSVVIEMFGWSNADMLKTYDDRPASDQVESSVAKLF
ncbi:MAG: site-specific integrase [Candidatus Sumerlaeales bacterium]|nr:site-specific integrase [Candidatus Sumerlaeales bacterium]